MQGYRVGGGGEPLIALRSSLSSPFFSRYAHRSSVVMCSISSGVASQVVVQLGRATAQLGGELALLKKYCACAVEWASAMCTDDEWRIS